MIILSSIQFGIHTTSLFYLFLNTMGNYKWAIPTVLKTYIFGLYYTGLIYYGNIAKSL